MHRLLAIAALTLLAGTAGCDSGPGMDYSAVELVAVHGTVTLDGQPLPGAVVTFEAPDGQFSYALTDSDGEYTLQFDSEMPGATPGAKMVRISTTRKIVGLNAEEAEAGELSEEDPAASATLEKEKVPARYNENSELTAEVTAEQTEYNFDLVTS